MCTNREECLSYLAEMGCFVDVSVDIIACLDVKTRTGDYSGNEDHAIVVAIDTRLKGGAMIAQENNHQLILAIN